MKNLIILIACCLFVSSANAVVFQIKNLCEDTNYHYEEIEILDKTTAGHLTTYVLSNNEIDYIGNEHAINSILGTPVGLDAFEVLSDTSMRVYGWCYSVNGVDPDVLSSEVQILPHSESIITWYYGYAELLKDDWISYCNPVYKDPKSFVCNK
jgi:hypothetical protein